MTTLSFYVGLATFATLSWWESGWSLLQLVTQIIADGGQISVWIASVYMGLFGSIIGLTAYFKGQDGIEASEAALFAYLEPAVYIPLGIVLLNEHIYPLQLISLAVILLGVWVAEKRRSI